MKQIEVNDITKYIDAAPKAMCTMFIGDTGCGKTQMITRYAEEHNLYLKTLILSQLEASETLGIPVQSKRVYDGVEYNTIETAVPSWVFDLAEHQEEGAMLYLDEFLCAEPAVMNAFLNFLTERKVGNIDLSNVKVVAATNIGNYTYEPDNNILSRFCMFYVVNTSYSKYLSKKYGKNKSIHNDYCDEEERDGVIFEYRSLKPRCQEMLMMLKDRTLLSDFYEGYTNRQYMPKFHNNEKIDNIVSGFAKLNTDSGYWYLEEDDYPRIAAALYKSFICTSNRKNKVEYGCRYNNIKYRKPKMMNEVQRIVDGLASV